jgi:uncharacterized repeat protein (TIGR01451 family)
MRFNPARLIFLVAACALAVGVAIFAVWNVTRASHGPAGTRLWAYEAAQNNARVLEYDIGSHASGPNCVPVPSINGRGIAFDPIDGNLWYTLVGPTPTFSGDGLIHKVALPAGCAALPSIPFGDGPGGSVQDAVGALDVDPVDGHIWAAGYQPIGGRSFFYKVHRTTGSILQSCSIPFASGAGQVGNDTLAVAKLTGLPGSGKYLLTDAGEFDVTSLFAIDAATCTGGGAGTIVTTYTPARVMTGIDFEEGKLIATDTDQIYDLGGPPFSTVLATMSAAPSATLEDITLGVAAVDLAVTKTDSPDPVVAGNQLTYTVEVTNDGPVTAAGVILTDTLPSGVTFNSSLLSQGSCTLSVGTLTCNLGSLSSGATATLTIVVTVDPATPSGTILTNRADVASATPDRDPSNNSDSENTTVVAEADLSITKTDAPDPLSAGATLTYMLAVANAGPSTATGVVVTDTLPAGATYVSATPSQGSCTEASGVVTCSLGTLANGASASTTIVVVPSMGCSIINAALVLGAATDRNLTNNITSARTAVVLDNFNRPDGGLGSNWSGATGGYRIVSNEVDVRAGGDIYWQPAAFGASQEACVTLTRIDQVSRHHTLMLKVQSRNDWTAGVILVSYNAESRKVDVEVWNVPSWKWVLVGSFTPASPVADGDRLKAQALAEGTVKVYIGDTLLGTADAGSFYAGTGGQIGLWYLNAQDAVLDDFSGGTLSESSLLGIPPIAAIIPLVGGTTVEAGNPTVLRASAMDVEDGPLTGAQLMWTSDRDGLLGTGEELQLAALSVGRHLITFTATDSDGNAVSTTLEVNVMIIHRAYLPFVAKNWR